MPFKPGKRPTVAKVKSVYILPGDDMPVDYRLKLNEKDEWKVFDVVFDGVSLLKNYRVDFQEHIRNEGLDSLIAALNSLTVTWSQELQNFDIRVAGLKILTICIKKA